MPGPMFWGLDGSHLDDDFAFSFHRTLAEWEAEQREHEEFDRRFNEKWKEREQLGVPASPWQRSYAAPDDIALPVGVRLHGIGVLLAELVVDLKEPAADRASIDRLRRDFGNLRDVVLSDDAARAESLLAPVLERFGEALDAVAVGRPDLQPKCADLQQRLQRFLEPPEPEPDWEFGPDECSDEDDVPF
jgi:hypothetical protein